jgi:hypothetical protein
MELIKPTEISGKIMTLIEEANEFMIFISPYYNIKNWHKLLNKISKANQKNIDFKFYVRTPEDYTEEKNINEILNIGFQPILIERLHAKIYFNESEAIISSMNLNESSDIGTLDIAVKTTTEAEYNSVTDFYKKYIAIHDHENEYGDFNIFDNLFDRLDKLYSSINISKEDDMLCVNVINRFNFFISNERKNNLRMNCVLSEKEYEYLITHTENYNISNIKIELQKGGNGYYSLIWGSVEDIKSKSIFELNKNEEKQVTSCILDFINHVNNKKEQIYEQTKSNNY